MKQYDVVVLGGGISGVAAAVCAAREGLSTLLIERFGSLGGAMSNSLVYPYMKHEMPGRVLNAGIFTEMKQRKEQYHDSSWETYKFVFDDMVTEAGVDVLFHTTVFETECEGRMVKSVKAVTRSGVEQITAKYFIDASGDGDLLHLTGCEYQLGREEDNLCQPMTTCFRVANVDIAKLQEENDRLQEKYKEYRAAGKLQNPRENILLFYGLGDGIVHFNTTRVVKHNPVDGVEVSKAEILARRQIAEMMDFLRTESTAFQRAVLISVANQIGIRESRKLCGVHVLTGEELKNCTKFDDCIAVGNYDIDIHNPSGTGTYLYQFPEEEYYQIPYRSLLPKEYDNLLATGRCLSADQEAHSAVRIMPICACLGQAAGEAVAQANAAGGTLPQVDTQALRKKLREDGAVVD